MWGGGGVVANREPGSYIPGGDRLIISSLTIPRRYRAGGFLSTRMERGTATKLQGNVVYLDVPLEVSIYING